MPNIPWEALGPLVRERVIVEGHTFLIMRPEESDHLLDLPGVRAAFARDEYLPYWTDLWPAARMLAKMVLRAPWPPDLEALEIGCGLGLPGLAALKAGLRVTFSDYDTTALQFAAENARLNGFTTFRTLRLDWREPPTGLQIPVLLGSDLVYELRSIEPLAGLIKRLLAPDGVCLLTDQDRVPADKLREGLASAGLAFTTELVRAGEPGGRRTKGTLYRIRHTAAIRP